MTNLLVLNSSLDSSDEKINTLDEREIEIIQIEHNKKQCWKKWTITWSTEQYQAVEYVCNWSVRINE